MSHAGVPVARQLSQCEALVLTVVQKSRDIRIDGARVHWVELGEPNDQPPLVLLHGLMDSHLTWRQVAPALALGRRVLMPDLLGCGHSDRPNASYTLEWHASIVCKWLATLELPQVDIVGHSYGGGVAQVLLLHCLERVRRLLLVASGGLGREVGFWLKFASFPHFVERYGQPFMAFGTRRAIGGKRETSSREDVLALAAMNANRGTARAFSRTVRDVIDFRGQTRLFFQRAHLLRTLPPIRVFWGDCDPLIPMRHGQALVAATENVELQVFERCGHYLHQEQPELFVRAALGFLNDPHVPSAILRPAKR
jgi:pimeloyl-ACP methyl ester carboxylesterase